jgi:putative FmdB family regulatory protein
MPIYVYRCASCDGEIERRQGFHDAPLATCEDCGGALRRVLQPVGIVFKGSGFYVTDSRNGGNGANGASKQAEDGTSSDKAAATSTTEGAAAGTASTSESSTASTSTPEAKPSKAKATKTESSAGASK